MGDPWADEGFGGENDWEGKESVDADLEDEDAFDPEDFDPADLEGEDLDDDEDGLDDKE